MIVAQVTEALLYRLFQFDTFKVETVLYMINGFYESLDVTTFLYSVQG